MIVAEYENRLQEKAIDMYTRINDRLEQLENAHQEVSQYLKKVHIIQIQNIHDGGGRVRGGLKPLLLLSLSENTFKYIASFKALKWSQNWPFSL